MKKKNGVAVAARLTRGGGVESGVWLNRDGGGEFGVPRENYAAWSNHACILPLCGDAVKFDPRDVLVHTALR